MAAQIAIIGLGPSAERAPIGDPAWEVWGVPWDWRAPGYDAVFCIYDEPHWRAKAPLVHALREYGVPAVWMQRPHEDVPGSLAYPFAEVDAEVFRGVPEDERYGSTAAYMLALAAWRRPERIGVWGLDVGEGYDHQRNNLAYLIGFARGRGIEVLLPPESRILTLHRGEGEDYPVRYGYRIRVPVA